MGVWSGDTVLLLLVDDSTTCDNVVNLFRRDDMVMRTGITVARYDGTPVAENTLVVFDSVSTAEQHRATVKQWLTQPRTWVVVVTHHHKLADIPYDMYRLRNKVLSFAWTDIIYASSTPTEDELRRHYHPKEQCSDVQPATRKYDTLASRIAMNSDARHVIWCCDSSTAQVTTAALKQLLSEDVLNDGRVLVIHGTEAKVSGRRDIVHIVNVPTNPEQWEYILTLLEYQYDRCMTSVRLYTVDTIDSDAVHRFENMMRHRHKMTRRAYGTAKIIDFSPIMSAEGGYVLKA